MAYDVASKGIGDDGAATAYRAVATVQPDGRADRFLRECQQAAGKTVDGDCAIEYRTPAWRPDARQLAFDAGRQLALISSTGTGFSLLPAVTANDSQPAFSPSGRQLAFTRRRRHLRVRPAHPPGPAHHQPWRRPRLVVGQPDRLRARWQRLHRHRHGREGTPGRAGKDPGWSSSGKSLILARRGGIHTVAADGKGLKRVLRCSRCTGPVFSPNGKLFAYDAPGVTVAQLSNGRKLATLVQDFSGGGESFDGSNPSWGRR